MSGMTFAGLPGKVRARWKEFFAARGSTLDERVTDDNAASMVVSDQAYALPQAKPFFTGFTGRSVAHLGTTSEVIMGLSADSRQEADEPAGIPRPGRPPVAVPLHGSLRRVADVIRTPAP